MYLRFFPSQIAYYKQFYSSLRYARSTIFPPFLGILLSLRFNIFETRIHLNREVKRTCQVLGIHVGGDVSVTACPREENTAT